MQNEQTPIKRPQWLKVKAPTKASYFEIQDTLKSLDLVTVCQEARCPNMEQCWCGDAPTATFMLMGDTCTRNCLFCSVKTGNPHGVLDREEPFKVGMAISKMKLDYVVLTSVDRDDLEDLGSGHFADTVSVIKRENPKMIVEALTPDFGGREDLIFKFLRSGVDVFAHNMETVERLTPSVRDRRATYKTSLKTLETGKKFSPAPFTKTSLMLGVGETKEEVVQTLHDLRDVGCDIVTFGQYLSPTARHKKFLPVKEYIHPDQFDEYQKIAEEMGFVYAASGPLVRSSFKAGEFFIKGVVEKRRLELAGH